MNPSHTPGPFHAHGCAIHSAKVWFEGKFTGHRYIGSTAPLGEDSMPSDEDLANAALFAAAPELLAALQNNRLTAKEMRKHFLSPEMAAFVRLLITETEDAIRKATQP